MHLKILILSLCCLAHSVAKAEGEFCLSGGFSSGYSCAFDKASGSRKAVYSLQFLANTGTEDKLLKRLKFLNLKVIDSAVVSERQHFYYLGEYLEERTAWRALDLALVELAEDAKKYRPELVSYTREYDNALPRIRLVERGVLAGKPAVVVAPVPQVERFDNSQSANSVNPFYTIQLAAFGTSGAQVAFVKNHSNFTLYCREKNNGLFVSYLGVFDSYSEARDYLNGINTFDSLGPYVVKLDSVEINSCSAS